MRPFSRLAIATGLALGSLASSAYAQEVIKLTVVAGHPPATPGVALVRDFLIPEIDKRLAAAGGKYKIQWTQAYAGAIAKPNEVLETIEKGVGDVGYMPALFEADKLPLDQVSYVTPFGTGDLIQLTKIFGQLRKAVPEMEATYKKHKMVHLANIGVDNYHIISTFPINSIADLKGKKFGTAGLASRWLEGSGWVPVKGALTTYYNSLKTGVIEGTIVFESAITPYKFYEVAPYITKVSFGAQQASDLVVNLNRWEKFPKELRDIFTAVAAEYEQKVAHAYQSSGEKSMETAAKNGAKISTLPDSERAKLAAMLPNIAKEWAAALDKKGQPGTKTLKTYMDLSRKAGIKHAREWDKE